MKNCVYCEKELVFDKYHPHKKYCGHNCCAQFWAKQNQEKRRQQSRESAARMRQVNHDEYRKYQRHYRKTQRKHMTQNDYDKENAKRRDLWRRRRMSVFVMYGGLVCSCPHQSGPCGEMPYEFLAIDHVNGVKYINGKRDRLDTGQRLIQRLRREGKPSPDYRILCHNCNSAWGFHGKCPLSIESPNEEQPPLSSHRD